MRLRFMKRLDNNESIISSFKQKSSTMFTKKSSNITSVSAGEDNVGIDNAGISLTESALENENPPQV